MLTRERLKSSRISRKPRWKRLQSRASDGLFILPALILVVGLILFPIVRGLLLSFQNEFLLVNRPLEYVGLDNYIAVLKMPALKQVTVNTALFLLGTLIVALPLGLGIAVLLNQHFRGRSVVRTAVLLPWAMPMVVIAATWGLLLQTEGAVNTILKDLGMIDSSIKWLSSTQLSLLSVTMANAWRFLPFVALVILAGLQSIDENLQEAALVDGATRWQTFWHVTIPQIRYMIMIAFVLTTVWTVNTFDIIYAMTKGGPLQSSETVATFVYRLAFTNYQFSQGAALSTLMFVAIAALAAVYVRLARAAPWENEE